MTTLRTDLIPNLFPNGIVTVSKASPAVVTVPVVARVVSATGTISAVSTSGITSGVTVFTTIAGTSVTAAATYTGVSQASTSGSGTGAVFTVVKAGAGTAYSGAVTITTTTVGSGYAVGDTITISGANLGGVVTTNDMTLTLAAGSLGGPWTATISNMTSTAGMQSGDIITATAGTGSFGAAGEVSVRAITGNQSITINKIAGSSPTAGTITAITEPAVSSLPPFLVDGSPILITGVENATLTFTESASTGTFQVGQTITQATTNANAVITSVNYNGSSSTLGIDTVEGTFNTTNLVSGPILGSPLTPIPAPTMTPTAVAGMTQLLTAGVGGGNSYYVDVLTGTTFALYTNVGLSTAVDSSAFSTAVANTGQYATIDTVVITEA